MLQKLDYRYYEIEGFSKFNLNLLKILKTSNVSNVNAFQTLSLKMTRENKINWLTINYNIKYIIIYCSLFSAIICYDYFER